DPFVSLINDHRKVSAMIKKLVLPFDSQENYSVSEFMSRQLFSYVCPFFNIYTKTFIGPNSLIHSFEQKKHLARRQMYHKPKKDKKKKLLILGLQIIKSYKKLLKV